jgi:hypothetical protein
MFIIENEMGGNVTHMEKRNAHWLFFGNSVGRQEERKEGRGREGGRVGDRLEGLGADGGKY